MLGEKGIETGAVTAVGGMEHLRRLLVADHRHVLVPALKRGLVDAKVAGQVGLPPRETTPHRPRHHSIHGTPGQVQPTGDGTDARFVQPVNDQRLEQGSEPRTLFSPRYLDLMHAVLGTFHPRHQRLEDRSVLAGIEMAPAARPTILGRSVDGAFWTGESILLHRDFDPHLATLEVQRHVSNLPRALDTQDPLVELAISHTDRIPPVRPAPLSSVS